MLRFPVSKFTKRRRYLEEVETVDFIIEKRLSKSLNTVSSCFSICSKSTVTSSTLNVKKDNFIFIIHIKL